MLAPSILLAIADSSRADDVASVCFVTGLGLLILGAVIGYWREDADIRELKKKIKELEQKLKEAKEGLESTATPTDEQRAAAQDLEKAASAIKGLLEAFPEKLRFAVFMMVVGTLLMSVATIQFGGTSIF